MRISDWSSDVCSSDLLGATQTFELGSDYQLVPRVEYNHYGTIWWDVANSPGTRRDPLDMFSARLTLKSGDRWDISLWGSNLTNEKYFQAVVTLLGVFTVNYRGPPQIGRASGRGKGCQYGKILVGDESL